MYCLLSKEGQTHITHHIFLTRFHTLTGEEQVVLFNQNNQELSRWFGFCTVIIRGVCCFKPIILIYLAFTLMQIEYDSNVCGDGNAVNSSALVVATCNEEQ